MNFEWRIIVECGPGCNDSVARVAGGTSEEDRDTPLRGHGATPLEAMADLVRCLYEWRQGGSDRWFDSPSADAIKRQFIDDPTKPNRGKPLPRVMS